LRAERLSRRCTAPIFWVLQPPDAVFLLNAQATLFLLRLVVESGGMRISSTTLWQRRKIQLFYGRALLTELHRIGRPFGLSGLIFIECSLRSPREQFFAQRLNGGVDQETDVGDGQVRNRLISL